MKKKWVIKCVYPAGGHNHQPEGKTVFYEDKQQASAACEVLNAVNRQPGLYFMPVESEV